MPQSFLARAWPALAFGFALTLGSSAGQTYFISLSSGEVRAALGLSDGDFGSLYTVATTASAITLVWLGKVADQVDLPRLALITVGVLAAVCAFLMGTAKSWWMLALAFYGLRLAGQGMLSHLAFTAMGRWFEAERGRAMSVAVLGFAAGEATLPFVAALALSAYSWRELWWMTAAVLALVLAPAVALLSQQLKARGLDGAVEGSTIQSETQGYQWSRGEVLRDLRFYALLPGVLASPFIITGVLFHQVRLVETKGWSLQGFATTYPLYAGAAILVSVGLGFLVDRFGARRVLPYYLLPLALGLGVLSVSSSLVGAGVFMTLTGASAGGATLVVGALWAELYGVKHLGAIRALAVSLVVFSTALAPGMMGLAIDGGVSLDWQYRALMLYVLVSAGLFAALQPALRYRPPRHTEGSAD